MASQWACNSEEHCDCRRRHRRRRRPPLPLTAHLAVSRFDARRVLALLAAFAGGFAGLRGVAKALARGAAHCRGAQEHCAALPVLEDCEGWASDCAGSEGAIGAAGPGKMRSGASGGAATCTYVCSKSWAVLWTPIHMAVHFLRIPDGPNATGRSPIWLMVRASYMRSRQAGSGSRGARCTASLTVVTMDGRSQEYWSKSLHRSPNQALVALGKLDKPIAPSSHVPTNWREAHNQCKHVTIQAKHGLTGGAGQRRSGGAVAAEDLHTRLSIHNHDVSTRACQMAQLRRTSPICFLAVPVTGTRGGLAA